MVNDGVFQADDVLDLDRIDPIGFLGKAAEVGTVKMSSEETIIAVQMFRK